MTIPCNGFTTCLSVSYSNGTMYIEAKVLVLLGHDVALLGNLFPTFRDSVVLSSSRVGIFKKRSDISALEFETLTLSRNVGNRIASDAKSYTRWTFQLHRRENVTSLRRHLVLKRKML